MDSFLYRTVPHCCFIECQLCVFPHPHVITQPDVQQSPEIWQDIAHHLLPQITQLNDFILAMQHTLRAVTELELIIQFLPNRADEESKRSASSHQLGFTSNMLSLRAEDAILASLARALPRVTHLGVTEGLPMNFQSIFSYFKHVRSVEQLIPQTRNFVQESSGWYLLEDGVIPDNPSANVCFSYNIWNSLPFRLASLTCHSLPSVPSGELHWSLLSLHLSRKPSLLWKNTNRLCILKVCALLEDAPHLCSLSTALSKHNSFYGGMCLPTQLAGMQTLHTSIEAGLVLGNTRGGVPVVCKRASEVLERCLSLHQLLNMLPSFPSFAACKLSLRIGEPASGCLYHLPRVFPCMETLILKGPWKVTELLLLSECTSLRSLELRWNPCITMDALYQIAVDMPWLNRLVLHWS